MKKIFIVRDRMFWDGMWYGDNTEVYLSKDKAEVGMCRRFNAHLYDLTELGEAILDKTLESDSGSFSTDRNKKFECWVEELEWCEDLEMFY